MTQPRAEHGHRRQQLGPAGHPADGLGVHRYRSDTYYGGGAWPVLTSAPNSAFSSSADSESLEASNGWSS